MSIEEDTQELLQRFDSLLQDAARNEVTLKKFQAFELDLMNASSLGSLITTLIEKSRTVFEWDIVTLTLFDPEYEIQRLLETSGFITAKHPELSFINSNDELGNLYKTRTHPLLDSYSQDKYQSLFPDDLTQIESVTLLPLHRNDYLFGSYNIGKFNAEDIHQNAATDFLQHLSAIISVSLENSIAKEHLQCLGLIDPLTNVNNRRYFDQRLLEEITIAIREEEEISCLFIDIDFFKKINDQHGHQAGDTVLMKFAKIIKDQVRTSDLVARYGGEEFIVLLPHKGNEQAIEIAERIKNSVSSLEFSFGNTPLKLTASIGINTLRNFDQPGDIRDLSAKFVDLADQALYRAKNNGRNRIEVFQEKTE